MARSFEPTAEGLSLLSPYWSSIVGARQGGFTRAETWSLINEIFQEGGPSFQGATIFDMNTMWGRAGELLNAETAFGAARPEDALSSEMWAWAPWASPDTAAWQTPNYMLNYATAALDAEGNILTDDDGNPLQVWGATDWQGSIDVTTQDVIDRVMGSAQAGLDVGSPGVLRQLQAVEGLALGPVLSVQILRF
jgi:hypothetical protein